MKTNNIQPTYAKQRQNVGMHPGASASDMSSNTNLSDNPDATATSTDANMSDTGLPQRKNIRATFHDYSGGEYFITICTQDKRRYFGSITDGIMNFTTLGKYAHDALETLHTHYSYVEVPMFVIMPNHIHAIINIAEPKDKGISIPEIRMILGVVVGGYKQSVTRFARRNNIEFGWQKRYHDHIIRGVKDRDLIAAYIETNVQRWDSDCYHEQRSDVWPKDK